MTWWILSSSFRLAFFQLRAAANAVGEADLEKKFAAASESLRRGIMFANSLYLWLVFLQAISYIHGYSGCWKFTYTSKLSGVNISIQNLRLGCMLSLTNSEGSEYSDRKIWSIERKFSSSRMPGMVWLQITTLDPSYSEGHRLFIDLQNL